MSKAYRDGAFSKTNVCSEVKSISWQSVSQWGQSIAAPVMEIVHRNQAANTAEGDLYRKLLCQNIHSPFVNQTLFQLWSQGNLQEAILWLRRRRPYKKSMGPDVLGNLLMKLTYAFMTCSSWLSSLPLPFDEGGLFCITSFIVWWSDNTQFMLSISGDVSGWWSMVWRLICSGVQ